MSADPGKMDKQTKMLIKVSTLGLSKKDTTVLKVLLGIAPSLEKHFVLLPTANMASSSVVFVNAEDKEAVELWNKFKDRCPYAIPVMVYQKNKPEEFKYHIKLPLNVARISQVLEAASSEHMPREKFSGDASNLVRILVVDDSLSVRKYMDQKRDALCEGKPVDIEFVESGEGAIENIKESSNTYHIVFLDVMMDDLNGYQVCKWIKSVNKKTTVVMLTNRDSVVDKMRGSMSGCDAYLGKPPRDKELKSILNKFIA